MKARSKKARKETVSGKVSLTSGKLFKVTYTVKPADSRKDDPKQERSERKINIDYKVDKERLLPLYELVKDSPEYVIQQLEDALERAVERELTTKRRGKSSSLNHSEMLEIRLASARIYTYLRYCTNKAKTLPKEYEKIIDILPSDDPIENTMFLIVVLLPDHFEEGKISTSISVDSFYRTYIMPKLKDEKNRTRCPVILKDFLKEDEE